MPDPKDKEAQNTEEKDPWLTDIIADLSRASDDGGEVKVEKAPELPTPAMAIGESLRHRDEAQKRKEEAEAGGETTTNEAGTTADEGTKKAAEAAAAKKIEDDKVAAAASKRIPVRKKNTDRLQNMVKGAVKDALNEAQPAAVAPAAETVKEKPAATPAPDQDLVEVEKGLMDEEREELELARFAERKNPEQFKGLAKKQLEFFRDVGKYIERARKENPDRTFDENDEEFQKFVGRQRPALKPGERRKLERDMLIEEARSQVSAEMNEKQAQTEKKLKEIEVRPRFEGHVNQFADTLITSLSDGEGEGNQSLVSPVLKAIQETGIEEAMKVYPLQVPIVDEVFRSHIAAASHQLAVSHGLAERNPEDPLDKWLTNFVESQASIFEQNGGTNRVVKDGTGSTRTFVSPSKMEALKKSDPKLAAKHWTFTDGHVLDMLSLNAKKMTEMRLKAEDDRMTRAGYSRTAGAELKKPEKKEEEQPAAVSPRANGSRSPGAGTGGSGNGVNSVLAPHELASLGFGGR